MILYPAKMTTFWVNMTMFLFPVYVIMQYIPKLKYGMTGGMAKVDKKNLWQIYDEAELTRLEEVNQCYRECLDEGKTGA